LAEPEISAPVYPLSRAAFKHGLATGHGRALIHAENFDVSDYRDEILDAATISRVYDTQMNGDREWWLARLCISAGLIERVIDLPPGGSEKDLQQRACLLKEFCLLGYPDALPALYAMCCRPENSNDVQACSELIEIEGEKGLIYSAQRLAEADLQDPDFWIDDWRLWRFDDIHGKGSADLVLTKAAVDDPLVRHYLREVAAYQQEMAAGKESKPKESLDTLDSVLQTIQSATKRDGRLRRWGNKASPTDRAEVAKLLKTESSPVILINVLWCLQGKGLPAYDGTLLELVFHEDETVRFHAAQVFSHHVEPQVRQAGLALLNQGDLGLGTRLLRLNAIKGDSANILAAVAGVQKDDADDDDRHELWMNLIQMLEENEAIREPSILLHVYEFTPCMHCRQNAMEILIAWKACPPWLLEEAAKDASDDIRVLAGSSNP
jgi:hypothetical protein